MKYLLGLDIGTSGVKALLVSIDGAIISTANKSYPLFTPNAGWSEQNPADWWESTVSVIRKILQKSGIKANKILGISLSGQMHSSVFLDHNLEVIRRAILWNDTRTSQQCDEIYKSVGGLKELTSKVSNPALEGFTASKILWLRKNEPENFKQLSKVLLPKDYIRYKLTGEIYMDKSDAAGTLLLDVNEGKWSNDILDRLNLEPDILPPLLNSTDLAGKITTKVSRKTNLIEGTPVIAGGADNACGAVGSGIIKEGRMMVSIGTSGVVLAQTNTPTPDKKGRIHLFNHAQPNKWYMMGVMLSAGGSFTWMKNDLYGNRLNYNELNKLAKKIAPGSEGLIFLPYLNGERTPHADANARGVFFGISNKHSEGHFIRSVMEGVSFGLRDSLELIKDKGIEIEQIRAIGGGMKSSIWQQILADILGKKINILNIEEGPAFGAALIAGVGVGAYENFKEAEENFINITNTISPIKDNIELYNRYYKIYKNLYTDLEKRYKQLAKI